MLVDKFKNYFILASEDMERIRMYAIIADGGKNYTVSPGQVVELEKKDIAAGKEIEFSDVLFYNSDSEVFVGTPSVEGVKVKGIVEGDMKADKVTVFKFKRRKNYRKKQGHRQTYTKVRIKEIVKG